MGDPVGSDGLRKELGVRPLPGVLFPEKETDECAVPQELPDLLYLGARLQLEIPLPFSRVVECKFLGRAFDFCLENRKLVSFHFVCCLTLSVSGY